VLTAEAVVVVATAGLLELLALGLGGLAVVLAAGSAIAAYGSRRALALLDDPADEPVDR